MCLKSYWLLKIEFFKHIINCRKNYSNALDVVRNSSSECGQTDRQTDGMKEMLNEEWSNKYWRRKINEIDKYIYIQEK